MTCCSIVGQTRIAQQSAFADIGSLFAFCGGAAIGHVSDAFHSLDMAFPLRVTSVFPMELAIGNSFLSMPTMCVHGLGHWLHGEAHRVERQIWLGISLGA